MEITKFGLHSYYVSFTQPEMNIIDSLFEGKHLETEKTFLAMIQKCIEELLFAFNQNANDKT
ncbi:unnamed protein product [marine sediment metagenome]|uniref:Uncharacterized protein n=1 Tax=marine sediment metagenome TaxID=412755 RepID=X1GBL8_9ZZZZ